jgi:hypothetical protein
VTITKDGVSTTETITVFYGSAVDKTWYGPDGTGNGMATIKWIGVEQPELPTP